MRSRAVILPCLRWRSLRASPPPSRACAFSCLSFSIFGFIVFLWRWVACGVQAAAMPPFCWCCFGKVGSVRLVGVLGGCG